MAMARSSVFLSLMFVTACSASTPGSPEPGDPRSPTTPLGRDASVGGSATPPASGAGEGTFADAGSTSQADGGAPSPTPDAGPTTPPANGGTAPPLPTAAGACPEFVNGVVQFAPRAGSRNVTIYMTDAAKTKHGPLIFYYYGTGGNPSEARRALTSSTTAIQAAGGIIVAPTNVQSGQFPWLGGDLAAEHLLVDEVVACAFQKLRFDTSHIHALGFSAGALYVTQLGFARSSYIASIGTYSGGLTGGAAPAYQNAANKWAAMAMTGGANDNVFGTDFLAASRALQTKLKGDGHYAMLCNHGGGHMIPQGLTGPVWQFFQASGFGQSPFASGLSGGFTNCTP